jgi:hypothetical protein
MSHIGDDGGLVAFGWACGLGRSSQLTGGDDEVAR